MGVLRAASTAVIVALNTRLPRGSRIKLGKDRSLAELLHVLSLILKLPLPRHNSIPALDEILNLRN